jgi:hypothetical protein
VAPAPNRVDAPEDVPPGGRIVEHHRLDPSGPVRRSLGLGAAIVSVGALVVGLALALPRLTGERAGSVWPQRAGAVMQVDVHGNPVEPPERPLQTALALLGLACITLGGGTTIVGLRRVLSDESYLALRTDGAYFRRGPDASLIAWDDVEEVRWDATVGAVRFERHDGSVWLRPERYADIDGATLAKRAAEIRRKALFGLLG